MGHCRGISWGAFSWPVLTVIWLSLCCRCQRPDTELTALQREPMWLLNVQMELVRLGANCEWKVWSLNSAPSIFVWGRSLAFLCIDKELCKRLKALESCCIYSPSNMFLLTYRISKQLTLLPSTVMQLKMLIFLPAM